MYYTKGHENTTQLWSVWWFQYKPLAHTCAHIHTRIKVEQLLYSDKFMQLFPAPNPIFSVCRPSVHSCQAPAAHQQPAVALNL